MILQRGSLIFISTKHPANKRWLARQLDNARREGRGLRVSDWSTAPDDVESAHQLIGSLMTWCKEMMATCRRPYGVDHFDLVLALRCEERVSNLSFSRLRVQELYDEDLPRRIATLLVEEITHTGSLVVQVAAGLFSWGDALHAVLGPTEQATSN